MRNHLSPLTLAVLAAAISPGFTAAHAQTPTADAATQTTGTPTVDTPFNESLFIGAGNLLHVQVFETPELDQRVRVDDHGNVSLLLIGTIHVGGLTPSDAASLIQRRLISGNFMYHPQVAVLVDQYVTENVTIVGQVRLPGAYSVSTPRKILEVLSLAGGLADTGDRHIIIERKGTGEGVPYFFSNDAKVAVDTQVMVYPGDTVVVPRLNLVYALGDVGHPGGYMMQNNDSTQTVLELIAQAGGTNHTAVPANARIIRKTATGIQDIPIQLSNMQKGKIPDMPLQHDDIVYVPFSYLRNLAVQASGILAAATSAVIYTH